MKGLIAFLLLLHFQTQAKEIITLGNASKVVQIPDDCLKTKVSCAFKTSKDEKFKFLIGKTQIVLDQNTAVFRKAENSILLVSGQIWIRARGNLKVQTEYGEAALEGGNFLIRNQENRMEVLAIDNDLILTPKMGKVGLRLEAGEQNWIGPVDANHAATSGVPLPIRPSELVVRWSRLYTGKKSDFENDFKGFFAHWSGSTERLAKFHEELTQRQIANVEFENERKKRIKEEQLREDRRIKDWFRKRELSE